MTAEEIVQAVVPNLVTPVSVIIAGYWIKSQLSKVDKITSIIVELRHIREKQTEIKVELERLGNFRDEFIVVKNEVKSQWKRIDENERRLREGNL